MARSKRKWKSSGSRKRRSEIRNRLSYDCTSGEGLNARYTSYSYDNKDENNGLTSGYNRNQIFEAKNYITSESDSNAGKWRILGAENGNLLIMAATNVPLITEGVKNTRYKYYMGRNNLIENSEVALKYGIEELDNISAIYGKGNGGTGVRSIKVEDINKITGYNPEKTGGGNNGPFEDGEMCEYGNKVTFTWKGDLSPYYTSDNGNGTLNTYHDSNGFTYWNEEKNNWVKSPYTSTAQTSPITTLISTYYFYYPETLTVNNHETIKTGILNDSKAKDMLFRNSDQYYLGSRYILCEKSHIEFGLRFVEGETVDGIYLFDSLGSSNQMFFGVRPVVYISSNTKIIGNEEAVGTVEKPYILSE